MKKIFGIIGDVILYSLAILSVYYLFFYEKNPTYYVEPYKDESLYPVFSGKNVYEYYRQNLNENQKIAYDELKEGFLQFKDKFTTKATELSTDELSQAFKAFYKDHAEIFWLKSYSSTYYTDSKKVDVGKPIDLKYEYSKEEAQEILKKIKPTYTDIIKEAKKLESDKEKAKYVHDRLIKLADIRDYGSAERKSFQSIVSIFDEGYAVCAGFSKGFKFIMDNLNIKSLVAESIIDDNVKESHAWNIVLIDNEWHSVDVTWDNDDDTDDVSYDYFMIDENEFYENHTYSKDFPIVLEA